MALKIDSPDVLSSVLPSGVIDRLSDNGVKFSKVRMQIMYGS